MWSSDAGLESPAHAEIRYHPVLSTGALVVIIVVKT